MKKIITILLSTIFVFNAWAYDVQEVGLIESVLFKKATSKPSVITVITGAALGGVIGHQFGGGSGKDIATGAGIIAGGISTDSLLTEEYNQIIYKIIVLDSKKRITLTSSDLNNNIFKNDIVILLTSKNKTDIESYGQYDKDKHLFLIKKVNDLL